MKLSFSLTSTKKRTISECRELGDDAASNDFVAVGEHGEIDYVAMARTEKLNQIVRKKRKDGDASSFSEADNFEKLKNEGEKQAFSGNYREAINCWEKAICFNSSSAEVNEMMAQAYLELDEPLNAIRAAEVACKLSPNWYVAKQTLGRSQLNLGDIRIAVRTFTRAAHLAPFDKELLFDDLRAAWKLLKQASSTDKTDVVSSLEQTDSAEDDLQTSKYFTRGSAVLPEGYTVLRLDSNETS